MLVPGLAFHDDVILPGSALRWLQRQPERLVSASAAQTEVIQPFYGFGHNKFADDPWTGMLVKTDLNAVLENICAAMNDELGPRDRCAFWHGHWELERDKTGAPRGAHDCIAGCNSFHVGSFAGWEHTLWVLTC